MKTGQSTITNSVVQQEAHQAGLVEVVVIDHSYLHMINWTEQFAKSVRGINVVLITDKLPSRVEVGFEVINVHDVAQNLSFEELERKLSFPLYRSLVAERAYFDYTHFTKSECYSRLSLDEIERRLRPHINALDVAIGNRGDLVIGHMADNAIASLAAHISSRYGKPYVASTASYWRPDALFIRDRIDQTSSRVDELYHYYYANQSLIDRSQIQTARSSKRYSHIHSDINVYSLKDRVKKVIGSQGWHDPF